MSALVTTRDTIQRESIKNEVREIILENDEVASESAYEHLKDWIYEYFALEFTSNYEIEKKIEYDDDADILRMTFKMTIPIFEVPEIEIKSDKELFESNFEEFKRRYLEFRKTL